MIVFDLKCSAGHRFEAWFRDSDTFTAQAAAGEVACPVCGDQKVEKALMAPRLNVRSHARDEAAPVPVPTAAQRGRRHSRLPRPIRPPSG